MTISAVNKSPYLRTSRNFPTDPQALSVENNRSYVDIAQRMNERVIGIYPTNEAAITGESWFVTATRQQTMRQMFPFSAAGNITHNINLQQISGFTRIYGTFSDGTNWYPLPYVDVVAANNQVNVIVTPTVITITAGGGAPPAITKGFVVVEWLANP